MADWKDAQLNTAKEILAYELTKLVHGEEEANKAQASAKALFMGGGDDANMPTTEVPADKLVDGKIGFLNLMVLCGLAPSNKQARQLVQQGGVFVNDEKMTDATFAVTEEMLREGVKIRKGKKVFQKAILGYCWNWRRLLTAARSMNWHFRATCCTFSGARIFTVRWRNTLLKLNSHS